MDKNENQLYREMINKMTGKIYNIECITNRDALYVTHSFGKRDIEDMISYKRYKNLRLENITGFCNGQLYFTTENGELILIPVSYIISILPVKNKEK